VRERPLAFHSSAVKTCGEEGKDYEDSEKVKQNVYKLGKLFLPLCTYICIQK
jgi:hypothetical protein